MNKLKKFLFSVTSMCLRFRITNSFNVRHNVRNVNSYIRCRIKSVYTVYLDLLQCNVKTNKYVVAKGSNKYEQLVLIKSDILLTNLYKICLTTFLYLFVSFRNQLSNQLIFQNQLVSYCRPSCRERILNPKIVFLALEIFTKG